MKEGPHGEVRAGRTITLKIGGAYLECEEGAEVNDLPAAARHHVLPRGLREQPYGLEVHVQDLLVSIARAQQRGARRVQCERTTRQKRNTHAGT